MCDIGLALGVGGAVLTGVGLINDANATADANKEKARIAALNAQISTRRAKDALARGRQEEQAKRMQVAQLQGQQVAAMAANGVDVAWGSPLDVLVDTAQAGELDALTIRRNSQWEAHDYRVQAANGLADSSLYGAAANSALTSGYLSAGGTILGGIGSSYSSYVSRQ